MGPFKRRLLVAAIVDARTRTERRARWNDMSNAAKCTSPATDSGAATCMLHTHCKSARAKSDNHTSAQRTRAITKLILLPVRAVKQAARTRSTSPIEIRVAAVRGFVQTSLVKARPHPTQLSRCSIEVCARVCGHASD